MIAAISGNSLGRAKRSGTALATYQEEEEDASITNRQRERRKERE